jgi:hypothetical protein
MRVRRNQWGYLATVAAFFAPVWISFCMYVAKTESSPRHTDTFRYQIECVLEDLGVIPFDPFRHVNG